MNEIYPLIGFIIVMLVMTIMFAVVFVTILLYLKSVHELNSQIKKHEPELWESLGSPESFAFMHKSYNPFKALYSQMTFCKWFLKGGEGAVETASIDLVNKTKKLFRRSMIYFVSLFGVQSILMIGLFIFMQIKENA